MLCCCMHCHILEDYNTYKEILLLYKVGIFTASMMFLRALKNLLLPCTCQTQKWGNEKTREDTSPTLSLLSISVFRVFKSNNGGSFSRQLQSLVSRSGICGAGARGWKCAFWHVAQSILVCSASSIDIRIVISGLLLVNFKGKNILNMP